MKNILPTHYTITEGDNWIRCKSREGLRTNGGNDDHEAWSYTMAAIEAKYPDLKEVYFNTNAYYSDFVIYI